MKIFITVIFLILTSANAFAQENTNIDIIKTNKQLENIEKNINQGKFSSTELTEQLKIINNIQNQTNQVKLIYQQKKENVQKRLQALGDIPTDGINEAEDIANKRKEFTKTEEEHKAQIAQIELINTKIDEINALILKTRNQSLLNRILVKDESVFQIARLRKSLLQLSIFSYNIIKSPYVWYNNLTEEDKKSVGKNFGVTSVISCVIFIASIYLSLYIRRRFGYKDCLNPPTYKQKIQSNLAMIFSFGIIPASIFGGFIIWIKRTQILLNNQLGMILYLTSLYLLIFFTIRACVKVIFVPKCSYWRIIKINDYKAITASRLILFWSMIILISEFFFKLSIEQKEPDEIIYLLQIINIFTKALGIIFVSKSLLYKKANINEQNEQKDDYKLSIESKIFMFISFMMLITMILSLIGYVRLADFTINRFIISILVILVYIIINLILHYLLHRFLKFNFFTQILHINPKSLAKTEFWLTVFLKPFIFICAIISILGVWGFSVDIMLHDIKNFLLGFNIGGMHISITSALMGILSFFVSMFVFKSLRTSLLHGTLSKIDMEQGSRSSLASSISLIGFIISVIIAITVMGGSLNNITLIAGALSFGIGLGLQNIVNNFVSGIIIIFEKPIKIGDWVNIKGQEGIVKTISMRATLLEAFDKSNIIIPNSEILSSSLVNRTYSARVGLIEIALNIKYTADIKYVEETLIDIASSTMGILSSPSPSVSFSDMTEKYLIFKLNCYTENIYSRQNIANQLRSKILINFTKSEVLWIG